MLIWQLLFILVLSFVVLAFFLRMIIKNASFKESKRLHQLVDDNTRKEQKLAEKISEIEKLYQERIAAAEKEVGEIKEAGNADISRLKHEALKQAEKDRKELRQQAQRTIAEIKPTMDGRIPERGVEIAKTMVDKTLTTNGKRMLHDFLLHETLEDIEALETDHQPTSTDNGEIISTYELDETFTKQLESLLHRKTGKQTLPPVQVQAETMGGITIKVGTLVIDGTLEGKLRRTLESIELPSTTDSKS